VTTLGGADLREANLSGTNIMDDQLNQLFSFEGAIMDQRGHLNRNIRF
jgi:hypothetical protein